MSRKEIRNRVESIEQRVEIRHKKEAAASFFIHSRKYRPARTLYFALCFLNFAYRFRTPSLRTLDYFLRTPSLRTSGHHSPLTIDHLFYLLSYLLSPLSTLLSIISSILCALCFILYLCNTIANIQ
jgi:hypothetical protein